MTGQHLWMGEWIDDAELARRMPGLSAEVAEALREGLPIHVLLDALQGLNIHLRARDEVYDRLKDQAVSAGTATGQDVEAQLDAIAAFTERENIEKKLIRELGTSDPGDPARITYAGHVFESWAPLGLLVHVAPTNVFTVGFLSLVEGLLSGNVNFLKTSASDTLFPQVMVQALLDCDRTSLLKKFVCVARISSRSTDLLKRLFSQADGIAAWGGEEAVAGVRALAPAGARVIEWGHKISFAYVAKEALRSQEILEPLARECCEIEQQACSSPQCIYVETSSWDELVDFGRRFATVLQRVSPSIPRLEPGEQEQAEITTVTELCRLESCLDQALVLEPGDFTWRVLIEFKSGLRASPLYRTVWIKPLLREEIPATLRPMRRYLQTVGLACGLRGIEEIGRLMTGAGVLRITPVGRMHSGGYMGEPHDGVYALQRYSRRMSYQLDERMAGLDRLSELRDAAPRSIPPGPVMTKEDFEKAGIDYARAQLYFKSGGTSGRPKLSAFSYEDYHAQMRAAAAGLYAAGLDPSRDRCINLFAAGHLYGGFLSFFTILEFLGAVHIPMALQDDLAFVGGTMISEGVTTVLGMPSYIMRLFEANREDFKKSGSVRKVLYAGEYMSPENKRSLAEEFGLELIRSAVYGSNDAGPMGFQCPFCEGSVHHLFTDLQVLEILDLEEDSPVKGTETGRLIFTSLRRKGQQVARYEIGDTGRWVPGACTCGRTSPRFEILGRHGDVFRVGATPFMNYKKIASLLQEQAGYEGLLQIELIGNEAIILHVSDQAGLDPEAATEAVVEHYEEIRNYVSPLGAVRLQVRPIPEKDFVFSPHSGKLLHIIRKEAAS